MVADIPRALELLATAQTALKNVKERMEANETKEASRSVEVARHELSLAIGTLGEE